MGIYYKYSKGTLANENIGGYEIMGIARDCVKGMILDILDVVNSIGESVERLDNSNLEVFYNNLTCINKKLSSAELYMETIALGLDIIKNNFDMFIH
jgi:hypothetical protein